MINNILNFEDVSEGMEIPTIEFGPITRQQLVDYASASGDYNKIHYDESFAKKAGLKGCITHGMLSMAITGSFITNWAKRATLKNFKVRFSGITNENDILTIKGRVSKKFVQDNEHLIEIQFQSLTQEKVVIIMGSALILLNSKSTT